MQYIITVAVSPSDERPASNRCSVLEVLKHIKRFFGYFDAEDVL